jgi:hypothetical protein
VTTCSAGSHTIGASNPHLLAMNPPQPVSSACAYALQLQPARTPQDTTVAGRLEHVMSGRRHAFDSGAELLACLAHEQLLAFGEVPPAPEGTAS